MCDLGQRGIEHMLHMRRKTMAVAKAGGRRLGLIAVLSMAWVSVSLGGTGGENALPTITASLEPAPNPVGWHNTPVTVRFSCADRTSGIATCSEAITVTAEGAQQVITGRAIDRTGHQATHSVTLHIDRTPPHVTVVLEPPPSPYGWYNTDVTVRFVATDALSGLVEVTPPITLTTTGMHHIRGMALDRAGNSTTASTVVHLEKSPPARPKLTPSVMLGGLMRLAPARLCMAPACRMSCHQCGMYTLVQALNP
jgi:hypothetical protein